MGQGEASPLPGYSRDTLTDAHAALGAIAWDQVPRYEGGESAMAWLARVATATPFLGSAARFATETALLDLLGQRLRQPLWTLLSDSGSSAGITPVPLCALVGGSDDRQAVLAATAAVGRGVHTVKVKITGPSLRAQLETLEAVRAAVGTTPLRLDANGTLDPRTARGELDSLVMLAPELVEEPVPTAALATLGRSPVPIALDESLQRAEAWATLEPSLDAIGCVALILKPMAIGGLAASLALAGKAAAHRLDVTVSHLFDGPVALAAATHLALAVAARSRGSGLERHGGLGAWPTVDIPHLGQSSVLVSDRAGLGISPVPRHRPGPR